MAVADDTRRYYLSLHDGIEILAGYYRRLAEFPLTRRTLRGHEVILSQHWTQGEMGDVPSRLLRSNAVQTWLPAPDIIAPEDELV